MELGSPEPPPAGVKLAAALLVAYGLAVVLNATVMQAAGGWGEPHDFPRAILRLIGAVLIAWGLLRRPVLALSRGLAVLVLERGDVYWLPPSGFQTFLVVSLVCLGAAVALLISPSARPIIRRPAG